MTFTSPTFLLFIFGTLLLYGVVPKAHRWLVLLTASYVFYGTWNWQALWVLVLVTLVSYAAARRMQTLDAPGARRVWLAAGGIVTLGSLLVFKYFNYGLAELNALFSLWEQEALPVLELAAPLGISFFTLQVYAYLMDVYHGQAQAETHLGRYALAVTFFPQMVAGPITRVNRLLPQIEQPETLVPEHLSIGFMRILWGGVQKFVIADRLAALISPAFDSPQEHSSLALLAALYLYAVQIYMDFAGYSNMAIGLARLFGFRLAENFNLPYLAKDLTDFWNRWHISLTHWLRDYIFYPTMRLVRKAVRRPGSLLAVFVPPVVTMLVSGIWHGPGTHYLFWGLYHGALLALSAASARWRKKASDGLTPLWRGAFSALQVLVTFHLVLVGWVFFRLPSMGMGVAFLRQIAAGVEGTALLAPQTLALVTVLMAVFALMEVLRVAGLRFEPLSRMPQWAWPVLAYMLLFTLLFMGNFSGSQPFIYEQF